MVVSFDTDQERGGPDRTLPLETLAIFAHDEFRACIFYDKYVLHGIDAGKKLEGVKRSGEFSTLEAEKWIVYNN